MKWPRLSARLLCLSHLTLLLKCLEELEEESSVCPSKSIATIRCLFHARERQRRILVWTGSTHGKGRIIGFFF